MRWTRLWPDRAARGHQYVQYARYGDVAIVVLALAMIPILLAPLLLPLTDAETAALDVADWCIYAAFVADFVIRLWLAPSVRTFLRQHWLDVVVLALPVLRVARIVRSARVVRLLRVTRLVAYWGDGITSLARSMVARGFHGVALVVAGLVVLSAALVTLFERGAGGSISSFGDALWWAVATVTTVGYGDTTPVTAEGRGVAMFLMLTGIVFYGILTANLAAHFVSSTDDREIAALHRKLDTILQRLDELEHGVQPPDQ